MVSGPDHWGVCARVCESETGCGSVRWISDGLTSASVCQEKRRGKKAGGGTAEADNAVFRRGYFPSTIYTHNRENGDGKRGEDAGEDFFVICLFFFFLNKYFLNKFLCALT